MDRSDEAPPAALQQLKWRLGRTAELGPLVSAAISATVCAAWLSHSARLYQALPWLFAMRFNSALGMLLAAMAFALHLRNLKISSQDFDVGCCRTFLKVMRQGQTLGKSLFVTHAEAAYGA